MEDICFVSLPAYGYFNNEKYEQTGGGGAKRQIYLLSKELAKEYNVGIIVGDYGQPKYEKREMVSLYRAYTPNETSTIRGFLLLYKAMKESNSGMYVYRGNPRKAAIVGAIARILNRKWVYHIASDEDLGRHYDRCSPSIKKLFRNRIRSAQAVIAQTEYQKKKLTEKFGVESTVIPNGYPSISFTNENKLKYFLWIGRIDEEQKRPHYLLEIAEELQNTQFRMIGIPTGTEYSKDIITRCGQLNNISYFESVPPDKIHEHYSNAIALINTSAYEGFPNTFLEAWRYGVPVVSLSVDSNRYFNKHIFDGFCRNKKTDLVDKIKELEHIGEKENKELQINTQQYFEKTYSIENSVNKYKKTLFSSK